jgi:ABC-2 type transport system ATP-binding protein
MIELKNITKTYKIVQRNAGLGNAFKSYFKREYKEVKALDDISFKINEGEMVGYIGPNGAGKSTTIKIMCGILTPDSGECKINGLVPYKQRSKYVKDIGVVFGNRSALWWDVPVEDSFELLKEIYNIPEDKYIKQRDMLTEMLNIKKIIKTPTRQLSLGQRMRCEIAAAFLHDPKIVFLDEPTIGLDSTSKIAVREFIKKINKEKNTTIILTTHDTGDIEALTKRIILIGKGKLLLDGSLNNLMKKYSKKDLNIKYRGRITELPLGMRVIEKNQNEAKIEIDEHQIKLADAIVFLSNTVDVLDLDVSNTPIDDVVANLYKEYQI